MRINVKHHLNLLLIATIIVVLAVDISPAASQVNVDQIEIVSIKPTGCPYIGVQARVVNPEGIPIDGLSKSDLILLEDSKPVDFDLSTVDAGVQVVIILDAGRGLLTEGATGASRLDEMKGIVTRYVDGMGEHDETMIVLQSGSATEIRQTFTSDKEKLYTAISEVVFNSSPGDSYGLDAVALSLEELSRVTGESKTQAIVFLSAGIQKVSTSSSVVEQTADKLGIPVHAILIRPEETEYTQPGLERLAQNTGGMYQHYQVLTDTNDLFTHLGKMRIHYLLQFTTQSGSTAERLIELTTSGSATNPPRAFMRYTLDLQPPTVLFVEPAPGTQIVRSTSIYDAPLDEYEPTSTKVSAQVTWLDGCPRQVVNAEFFVNGTSSGFLLDPGTAPGFAWDLRGYRKFGEDDVQLRIQVQDTLGFISSADAFVSVFVSKLPPTPTPPPPDPCDQYTGIKKTFCESNKVAGGIALVVALVTLFLVVIVLAVAYRNRDRLLSAAQNAGSSIKGTWDRLTGGTKEKIVAYLTIENEPYKKDLGERIPLYRSAPTTIGRSQKTNKVVIPTYEDREPEVSKEHCVIQHENGEWFIWDTNSTNGTMINGIPLNPPDKEKLDHKDEVVLGRLAYGGIRMVFYLAQSDSDQGAGQVGRVTR